MQESSKPKDSSLKGIHYVTSSSSYSVISIMVLCVSIAYRASGYNCQISLELALKSPITLNRDTELEPRTSQLTATS